MTTSVPQIQFTRAGLILPQTSEVLTGVLTDIDIAFGGGINQALETPQGQLASSQTAIIDDKNSEIANVVNNVDPLYADGRWQDAIARIYFLNRKGATSTSVLCTLTGLSGTVIPAGTLALDTSGNRYASTGVATIGITGQVDVEFQNVLTGEIPCAAGTLNIVYQAINGWDAITNTNAGTLGQAEENRTDFEFRRRNSVALNGRGSTQSIYANVFNVDNVLDCYVIDNPLSTVVDTGSTDYPVAPNSVYVAVVGGDNDAIAQAIWDKKDLGCNMNGNTTVNVVDDSGYNFPFPTYEVKFERPDPLPILFQINIVDNPSLPSDIVAQIKAAVIARFNGVDGTTRERIGSLVLASRYYGAVASTSPSVNIIEILIGTTTANLNQVSVGIDQRPTINAADITVTLV